MTKGVKGFTKLVSKMLKNKAIVIPITDNQVSSILKKHQKLEETTVDYKQGHLLIAGKVEFNSLPFHQKVPFKVELKPIVTYNRVIVFEVIELKPINIGLLNNKILSRPYLKYHKKRVYLNLNALKYVDKIPFGNLKALEIKNKKMYLVLRW